MTTQLSVDAEAAGFSKICPACGAVACPQWLFHLEDHVQFASHCLSFKRPVPDLKLNGPRRWVSAASEGEPPVTDNQFAVLLISREERDFTTNAIVRTSFLRPHYPGAKKPVPSDCYWIMLPSLPAAE